MSTLYDVRAGDLVMMTGDVHRPSSSVGLFGISAASMYVPSNTIVLLLETPLTEAIEVVQRQLDLGVAAAGRYYPGRSNVYRYVKVLYEEAIYEVWLGNVGRVVK